MLWISKRLWALPWTLCGLSVGLLTLVTGGRVRRDRGTLAFSGGAARGFLRRVPLAHGASAMTLGHVVLGRSEAALDAAFEHELVHVRQYERWGPLFVPAYLTASAWQWMRGRDPYWDNPFERAAYDVAP